MLCWNTTTELRQYSTVLTVEYFGVLLLLSVTGVLYRTVFPLLYTAEHDPSTVVATSAVCATFHVVLQFGRGSIEAVCVANANETQNCV